VKIIWLNRVNFKGKEYSLDHHQKYAYDLGREEEEQ
jgi:hypothetical protein